MYTQTRSVTVDAGADYDDTPIDFTHQPNTIQPTWQCNPSSALDVYLWGRLHPNAVWNNIADNSTGEIQQVLLCTSYYTQFDNSGSGTATDCYSSIGS